ncbi:nitroreductase family protein [Saccharibacillus sp. CPCC 101409]|uniref:nitroreductase family protein n=1 Tax=Saccharibacillus sp. CPCC 101409 TaxID=3058041 RepID=UPI002672B751|nr:nitroreductase family protein [Saccharibacillus sp. CPCC 101409]MDO3411306.1 nitroreductase family protein [Saccharibacillus sp. CPCC 101409]
MNVQELLAKRRSVRYFDPAHDLDPGLLNSWIDGASRSPNGNNIQAVRYLHIRDRKLREELLPAAAMQKPVTEASALLLVLGDYRAFEADNIRRIQAEGAAKGCFDEGTRQMLEHAALGYYGGKSRAELGIELTRDAALASMSLLLLAAEAGYDALTMSGYDSRRLRSILKLPDRYMDIMLIAIGKRIRAGHRTVRHPVERILFTDRIE